MAVERPQLRITSKKTPKMLKSEGFKISVIRRLLAVRNNYTPGSFDTAAEEEARAIAAKPIEKKQLEFARFWAIRRGDFVPNPGTTPVSFPVPPEQREKAFDISEILRNKYIRRRKRKTQEQKAQEKAIYWEKRQTFFVKQNNWLQGEVDKDIAALRKPSPEEKLRQTVDEYLAMKEAIPVSDNPNDSITPEEVKQLLAEHTPPPPPKQEAWEITITEENAPLKVKFTRHLHRNGYAPEDLKRVPKKDSDLKLSEKERAHLDGITAFIETIPEELPPSPERPKQEKPKATPPPKVISKPESFAVPAQNIPSVETPSPSSPDTFSDNELTRLLALRKQYAAGAFNEKTTEAKRLEVTRWEYQHHKLNEGFPRRREIARLTIEQPQAISLLEVTKKPNYARPEPKPAQRAEKSPTTLTPEQKDRLQKLDETIGKTPEEIPVFSWKPRNDRFTSRPMLPQRRRRRGRPSSGKAMSHTL